MAALPRSFPLPRGNLTQSLGTYYINQTATGSVSATASTGYSQVGLFNNSKQGFYLYVIGCALFYSISTGTAEMRLINGPLPGGASTPGTSVNPLTPQLDGTLMNVANAASQIGGTSIWRFGGGGNPDFWPYDGVFMILSPGWGIYAQGSGTGGTMSAAFRWVVIRLDKA